MRRILGLIMGSIPLIAADPAFSQQRDSYAHGHMWDGGGWFLGPMFMLLLLAAIVAIVLLLVKHAGGSIHSKHPASMHHQETPLDILKIRYAKGEIDHQEFELRRKTLET